MTAFIDLDGALTRVYDALVARLDVALPARRFVTVGEVAFDCEQFAVSLAGVIGGTPGSPVAVAPPYSGYGAYTANFDVVWTTCVPVPKVGVPSPAALATKGHQVAVMGGAVLQAALEAWNAGELCDPCFPTVAVGPVAFIGPDGGVFGVLLSIGVQVA